MTNEAVRFFENVEREGYEIGRRGLSAAAHARYRSETVHNAWLNGWERGYYEYVSARLTCLSCGAQRERDQQCCGH